MTGGTLDEGVMEWEIVSTDVEARVSGDDTQDSLGELLSMWAGDRDLRDWNGREQLARIAVDYTDLDTVEIWAVFDVDPNDLPECGDPPWTFTHPSKDEVMTIRHAGTGSTSE